MPLQLESTRVLLKSDDSLWYWLQLGNEEGVVFIQVDTSPVTPNAGADEFVNLIGDDASIYALSLSSFTDEQNVFIVSPLLQASSGGYLNSLRLQFGNSYYNITVVVEDNIPMLQVALDSSVNASNSVSFACLGRVSSRSNGTVTIPRVFIR